MIEIAGGTISSTTSWSDPGTAIAVTDGLWIEGSNSPVLTLGAGMTLMFAAANPPLPFSVGYGGPGSLVIAGTPAAGKRVVLTSLAASPDQGDWVGIEVWADGSAHISYADISYAGSDSLGRRRPHSRERQLPSQTLWWTTLRSRTAGLRHLPGLRWSYRHHAPVHGDAQRWHHLRTSTKVT
jgi:hypothetical protein